MTKTLRPAAPLLDVEAGDRIALRVPRAFAPSTDTEVPFDTEGAEVREVELTGVVTSIEAINERDSAGFQIVLSDGHTVRTSRYNTSVCLR